MLKIGPYSQERNEFKDDELVCYCFGYTRKDIEKGYADNKGQSTTLERIASEKNAGQCDCAQKNPEGH